MMDTWWKPGAWLGVGALWLSGCFVDQLTRADRICALGSAACGCMSGDVCAMGLQCEEGTCRSPRCEDGRLGCACKAGDVCDPDLSCVDQSCLPLEETNEVTHTPTTTEATTSVMTTAVGSQGEATDSGMGGGSDSGSVECGCGWVQETNFYDCVESPGPDPSGTHPLECPEKVEEAVMIQSPGEVPCIDLGLSLGATGCCVGSTVVFCSDQLQSYSCDDGWCAPPPP